MKNNKILFIVFLTALMSLANTVFAGLGISPSDWVEPNGLMGQRMEKIFTLSRSNTAEDLNFTAQISGDINGWIKIENGDSFVMAKGQQQLPVKVIVTIPKNAAQKEYKADIRLNSESKTEQGGQIGVLLSSLIRIDLTVSDKPYLDYDVLQIKIPTQETGKVVNASLKIWNKGNVTAKPTKITLDIFDKFNSTKLNSQTLTDFSKIKGVGSFSEGEINFKIPLELQPEQYWANISVYQDDKILKTDSITFDIVEAGTLKKGISQNGMLLIAGIILALLIVVGIIIGIWLMMKKKKNNINNINNI